MAKRLQAEKDLSDSTIKVTDNPRTMPYFYSPKTQPKGLAQSSCKRQPTPEPPGLESIGKGLEASSNGEHDVEDADHLVGGYCKAVTLANELDLLRQKEKKQSDAKPFNTVQKRSLKRKFRPKAATLEEELQMFTADATTGAHLGPTAGAGAGTAAGPSRIGRDVPKLRLSSAGPAALRAEPHSPEPTAASPRNGRKQRILFQPMQHPGDHSEANVGIGTPRLSTSPSSPMYCLPGAGPSKCAAPGPQAAGNPGKVPGSLLRRQGLERNYALALDAENFSLLTRKTSQITETAEAHGDALAASTTGPPVAQAPGPGPATSAGPSGSPESPVGGSGSAAGGAEKSGHQGTPLTASKVLVRPASAPPLDRPPHATSATGPEMKQGAPTVIRAASTPLVRRSSSALSATLAGSKASKMATKTARLKTAPKSNASASVVRQRLPLWKPSTQRQRSWPPSGGSIMAGIATKSGVITAAAAERRMKQGHDALAPSHAAYLLSHLASRQSEVLKSLEADPIFSISDQGSL